jgi:ABC-type phosphate transport system permease subunit
VAFGGIVAGVLLAVIRVAGENRATGSHQSGQSQPVSEYGQADGKTHSVTIHR